MNMSPRKTYAMCECALYRQKTVFKTVCGRKNEMRRITGMWWVYLFRLF